MTVMMPSHLYLLGQISPTNKAYEDWTPEANPRKTFIRVSYDQCRQRRNFGEQHTYIGPNQNLHTLGCTSDDGTEQTHNRCPDDEVSAAELVGQPAIQQNANG